MIPEIKTINLGGVNCYLLKAEDRFILIDTGLATQRGPLEQALARSGCKPENLELILLTHGDIDHAENTAYLRDKYGAKIAMHRDDTGMVERGDMSWNRKAKPDYVSTLGRGIMLFSRILLLLNKQGEFQTFKPDLYIEDGQTLSPFGFDAQIIHVPGHSKGSIAILTASGALLCGDLFMNFGRPGLHFSIDDLAAAKASLAKLKALGINTVYPGHGPPFAWEQLGNTWASAV